MSDIDIRITGQAGRITLNRPKALNALNWDMVRAIDSALRAWATDDRVAMVIIDAVGEKAFCAGGDIAQMYAAGVAGNFDYARRFWRDEYAMNARLFNFPKPVASFFQGFCMGGGVGIGCHASHRIVGRSSQISMPECGIGLIPDVGGSLVLARAPGRLGEYLGVTGARLAAGDAIYAGFADYFVPEPDWPGLISALEDTGDWTLIDRAAVLPGSAPLADLQGEIDHLFGAEGLVHLINGLEASETLFAKDTLSVLRRMSPLSAAATLELVRRVRGLDTIEDALRMEYRFTHRAMDQGDFLEGIRAAIIDKDRNPQWRHSAQGIAPHASAILRPLGQEELDVTQQGLTIGFIGLGNMGAPMARNLAAAGHTVRGFDVTGITVEGCDAVDSAEAAAQGADVVITMLPNGAILRDVAAQIHPAMGKGAVHLDCSTVDVESAQAVAKSAEAVGLYALDAPVSGGVGGAAAGTLTFMVGGAGHAMTTCAPLFDIMGQKAVHCGGPGMGQAAKICNNMILGVTMIATCEAFALADKLGLDRQSMFDVVSTSSGYSWSMNAYCPAPGVGPTSPADNGYAPGFAAELMLKDLRLSQQAAESVDAATPMGRAAATLYEHFVDQEGGRGKDFSAMLPRFEKARRG